MKIVFNNSLPRSGSTLLQNILAQNPRFYCTPTSGVFKLIFTARQTFTSEPEFLAQDPGIMRKALAGYCAGGLKNYFSAITDREVCVDKSRGWVREYDWLKEFCPNLKILVPIRDLRAILSSLEKRLRQNPHQHPHEYVLDASGLKMASIENRVTYWLNSAGLGSGILELLDAVHRGNHRYLHIVRFEDLTSRPKEVMDGIYDYLEEPRFTHDFANVEQVTRENDSYYPIYGDHKIRSEVKPVPLDFHETLGKNLSNSIKQSNADFYSAFYPGR